ncbi:MAG: hypothetical protein ACJ74J_17475 [Blastocatellia bacterium]
MRKQILLLALFLGFASVIAAPSSGLYTEKGMPDPTPQVFSKLTSGEWCPFCWDNQGKNCCGRCNTQPGKDSAVLEIGPMPAEIWRDEPVEINFKVRRLGIGDLVEHSEGHIDWGDGDIESIPVENEKVVRRSHTYHTAGTFIIRARAGARFKYDGNGSCSYSCCIGNASVVKVKLPKK